MRRAPPLHATAAAALATGLLLACAVIRPPAPAPAAPTPERAAALADRAAAPSAPACARIRRIEIRKRERALLALCADGTLLEVPVALGREPRGPKRCAGDLRTPEGLYHVSGPSRPSRFHRFLPLDYPSLDDAAAAQAAGRLSAEDYEAIASAHRRGGSPPQGTSLGGGIGLHGEGEEWEGASRELDWTLGCLGMRDEAIDFLAERVAPGTPVRIRP